MSFFYSFKRVTPVVMICAEMSCAGLSCAESRYNLRTQKFWVFLTSRTRVDIERDS